MDVIEQDVILCAILFMYTIVRQKNEALYEYEVMR